MQRFRAFMRSWCDHDELSFRRPFRSGSVQFSNSCRTTGGDPRASSPTRRFPKERVASSAPPALRPALVGLALAMVAGWRHSLHIVRPDTVIAWHRRAFAWYWTRKSRRRPGRPNMAADICHLIRDMSQANPLWGAPRIHGELLKLGIEVAQSTVAKYLRRPRKPPSQTWRTFLTNHLEQMASIDFFVVPTATFRVLFVFVVLSHARRRVLHFQVTEHPSQDWTMQQIREAFPWDQGCQYLLRDRDAIYGDDWVEMTKGLGIEEVITAPRSPWQNPFLERLIGSVRRECLDHMIVWNERSLRRTLRSYFAYYQDSRTHLALANDAPESRAVEKPERGRIVVIPQVGGLHHRYQRHAA